MEPPIVYYSRSEYIETDTGNKVSRKSVICGSQNIILGGKTIIQTDCVIRGDLRRTGTGHAVVVAIGRYCLLSRGCIIRPPYKTYKGIEDNTVVPPNAVVPSFSVYEGSPGEFVNELPECVQDLYEAKTKDYYSKFQPKDS
ncbi:10965_t:CDS:2 [Entrophospora sp. SA101]|nr:7911_t:CDS:2 [Entrophospora candida]CAH1763859.1 10965_t:CDS:2 [Entrophospora sp. SA101]